MFDACTLKFCESLTVVIRIYTVSFYTFDIYLHFEIIERMGDSLFIAGALSGIAEAICVQPFDIVKTRHQINTGKHFNNLFRLFFNLYKYWWQEQTME